MPGSLLDETAVLTCMSYMAFFEPASSRGGYSPPTTIEIIHYILAL
jgi:hypothetical protein